MTDSRQPVLALFFCQQLSESSEQERQSLEKRFQERIRFFPLPCGGRLEPLHLLKALELFADAAYVITCPPDACRYFEGNLRARKRVGRAKEILASIGLEEERVGILDGTGLRSLADCAEMIFERVLPLGPSPVLEKKSSRSATSCERDGLCCCSDAAALQSRHRG